MAIFYETEGTAITENRIDGGATASVTLTLTTGGLFTVTIPYEQTEGHAMLTDWRLMWHDDDPDNPLAIVARQRVNDIHRSSDKFEITFDALKHKLYIPLSDDDAPPEFARFMTTSLWLEMIEV